METWLAADTETLAKYFGKGFNAKALPSSDASLEKITKEEIFDALKRASSRCGKHYEKGRVSFELLGCADPGIVISRCLWAKRFSEILKMQLKP